MFLYVPFGIRQRILAHGELFSCAGMLLVSEFELALWRPVVSDGVLHRSFRKTSYKVEVYVKACENSKHAKKINRGNYKKKQSKYRNKIAG